MDSVSTFVVSDLRLKDWRGSLRGSETMLNGRNWHDALEVAVLDPVVGIRITARLAGDDTMGLYATELAPGKRIKPHFHREGVEMYLIQSGEGAMHLGTRGDKTVAWQVPVRVTPGDAFSVPAGMVHQLENIGITPLVLLFTCASSHLCEVDRTAVAERPDIETASTRLKASLAVPLSPPPLGSQRKRTQQPRTLSHDRYRR
jgi:mannose-6-phosphate isomerase-like protein (cupin superfamily)